MHQILIVKTSSLGDIVHTFPAVAYLKYVIGVQRIDWLVEQRWIDLVARHPLVSKAIPFDRKKWDWRKELREVSYDAVFDLQGNAKSALGTFFARSSVKVGFDWGSVPEWPNLLVTNRKYHPPVGMNIRNDLLSMVQQGLGMKIEPFDRPFLYKLSAEEMAKVDEMVPLGGEKKILVAPGSRWANKQMEVGALVEFLLNLQRECGLEYLFSWGGKDEKEMGEKILSMGIRGRLLPRMELPMLQVVMDRMAMVVAMDSLPLHLAGTTSAITFAPFGASLGAKYAPIGENHFYVQGQCPYGEVFSQRCAKLRDCTTGSCIRSMGGRELFQAFTEVGVMRALKSRCDSTT